MVGLGFLLPQGSHPAPRDFKPGVPVEPFLGRVHVDVEGFLAVLQVVWPCPPLWPPPI